jgi:hypothetical protein
MYRRVRRALAINSILVVAFCLLVISGIAAVLLAWPNSTMILGALPIVLLFATIAIQQYRGVFRYSARAAEIAGWALWIMSALLVTGMVCILIALLNDRSFGDVMRELWFGLIVWTVGVAGFVFAGYQDILWARAIRKAAEMGFPFPRPRGFSLRELLGAMTAVALLIGFAASLVHSAYSQSKEHVAGDEAPFSLPADAADVSYYWSMRGAKACEFDTSEAEFRNWVAAGIGPWEAMQAGVALREIDGVREIDRYQLFTTKGQRDECIATVRDGLYYSWSNGDNSVEAVFDRATGRGYYNSTSH